MKCRVATILLLAGTALPLPAQESELDRLKKDLEKVKADNAGLLRQLETQSAQVKELLRSRPPQDPLLPGPAAPAPGVALPASPTPLPRPLSATVTAVANEIGLVVISCGKDDGVQEGDEFLLTRNAVPVAKVVIDRCDPKWSAGKVTQTNTAPCVGDRATSSRPIKAPGTQQRLDSIRISVNLEDASLSETLLSLSEITGLRLELDPSVLLTRDPSKRGTTFKIQDLSGTSTLKLLASSLHLNYRIAADGRVLFTLPPTEAAAALADPTSARAVDSAQELRALRKELDDVRSQVRDLSDRLVPSWQELGLATEELSEALRSQLNLAQGVVIRQVKEGSRAARLGLKPFDVVRDLEEPELLRILKDGGRIILYRQGMMRVLEVDRAR
jgi:hypothetical protein